jgi:hypothetical protein
MHDPVQNSWIAKRNRSIERLVNLFKDCNGSQEDLEDIEAAKDALAIAHIAASLELERVPANNWREEGERAILRLIKAWIKYSRTKDDPEAEEELNIALDTLAVAHSAATFEWASGSLKW